MGTGKTEAALGAAYQLLADKKARGIYFALPTQATSNRMHLRMAEFVRALRPRLLVAGSSTAIPGCWTGAWFFAGLKRRTRCGQ